MRVSTSMLFGMGREAIQRQSAEFANTQLQLASGKRILKPSDDPVAAARALEVSHSKGVNLQYRENQGYAQDALRRVDGVLASASELITYVRSRAVEAGNPTYTQAERTAIAADLRAQYEQLRGLANTRDAEGNYLFAGFGIDAEPFPGDIASDVATNPTGPTSYAGDGGIRRLQVSASREMPVGTPGDRIFGTAGAGVFEDMRTLIVRLESGTYDTAVDSGNAISAMDAALDVALTERASVGSRLVELDALDYASGDYDLQYAETLSRLQDLDYAEGISRFTQQQTLLEAAQQSYVRVTGLSLFNFLR
ncbi:MAG TPA: flagellar hook-associated protein FlgL [Rhodocyclaceae bacterium]|nr:flagellar hook-associated protein FlgL [Rhodocyclaceae bacterium]